MMRRLGLLLAGWLVFATPAAAQIVGNSLLGGGIYSHKSLGPPGDYGHAAAIAAGTTLACDDPLEWTGAFGTTFTADTVNVRYGAQSTKFTGGSANLHLGYLDFGSGTEVDFTNKILHVRVYLHPGADTADPKYVTLGRVYLTDSTANPLPHFGGGSNSYWINLPQTTDDYLTTITRDTADGWYEWHIPVTSMAQGGTMNIAAVRALQLYFIYDSGKKCFYTIDRIGWYDSPLAAGRFAIRIDYPIDGTTIVDDLNAYADTKGITLSWGIMPSEVATNSVLNAAALAAIEAAGHEVVTYAGNASLEYPVATPIPNNWYQKTWDQSVYQINYNRTWWATSGITLPGREILFVSGGTGWTTRDDTEFLPRFLAVASDLRGHTNPLNDPRYLYTSRFLDNEGPAAPADIAGLIAGAEASKTALIIGAHVDSANEQACLKAVMDLLAASTLAGKTFTQLYKAQ